MFGAELPALVFRSRSSEACHQVAERLAQCEHFAAEAPLVARAETAAALLAAEEAAVTVAWRLSAADHATELRGAPVLQHSQPCPS